ncbi:MAG: hypothetical protein EON58_19560 [Alphaproteobacteria bacterium]|nr:MAG: hypothetical protein EON58_19560 [Alphaproteobacteria bacterium]
MATTSWGVPDIQGSWTNASLTRLQRGFGASQLVMSPEEVTKAEQQDYYNNRFDEEKKPSDTSDTRLLDGTDLLQGSGYNVFWIDPGNRVGVVQGEARSSWITEPADGRIPYKNRPAPRQQTEPPQTAAEERRIVGAGDSKVAPGRMAFAGPQGFSSVARASGGGAGGYGSYDGPENRTLADRCLLGFGTVGGPVMSNVMYNNNYHIVQTPGHVMILVEMVHDARIAPVFSSAAEARSAFQAGSPPKWLGESVAWYEGSELVVETRNVDPRQRGYLSPTGILIERFSRWKSDELVYAFEVNDPSLYTQAWKGEQVMRPARASLYEYACHEGNYAMVGILAGARRLERDGLDVENNADEEGGGGQ